MTEQEIKQKVIEEYRITKSGGSIAKKYKVTNYKVYKWLREAGFEIRSRGPEKYTLKELVELYENGMSMDEISKKLDIKSGSIYERFINHGVKIRSKREAFELKKYSKIPSTEFDNVVKLYQNGMSSSQIAKQYGIKCKDRILSILKERGVERRNNFGSNNPSWKDGRTPLHTLIRNSAIYDNFRKEVMEERNYTCEITGQKGNKLNIHHVKPFNQLITEYISTYGQDISDRDKVYTNMIEFKPFWNKDNIILITEDLHYAIHAKYGKECEITREMINAITPTN